MNSGNHQFHRSESVPSATLRLVEMLDHIEQRVELLREQASAAESEKKDLLDIICSFQTNKDLQYISEGEREEIEITAQRLLDRTVTVQVEVQIPRNEVQQRALDNVNKLYINLNAILDSDINNARAVLQQYINACVTDCRGPINHKFQAAILELTADDQKHVRKTLEGKMNDLLRKTGRL